MYDLVYLSFGATFTFSLGYIMWVQTRKTSGVDSVFFHRTITTKAIDY